MNTNTSASSPYFIPPEHDDWVSPQEEEIQLQYDDDDDVSSPNRIPVVWAVMMVVFASGLIGVFIFWLSYRQERRKKLAAKGEEAVSLRAPQEIERGLKLKKWESLVVEVFDDESTQQDSSFSDNDRNSSQGGEKDEDDRASVVSDDSAGNASCSTQHSVFMQDPDFVRLQQKPRCVLCSKFFTEADTVTESWEPSCTHNFHKECLVKWLQKNDGCPVCKKAYVVGLTVQEP